MNARDYERFLWWCWTGEAGDIRPFTQGMYARAPGKSWMSLALANVVRADAIRKQAELVAAGQAGGTFWFDELTWNELQPVQQQLHQGIGCYALSLLQLPNFNPRSN